MGKKIDRKILACSECKSGDLSFADGIITCGHCGSSFSFNDQKFFFSEIENEEISDSLDRIKYRLKSFHRLYNLMIWLISPVFSFNHQRKFIKKYIEGKGVNAINLGSGSSNLSQDVANVDIFPYDTVDLTCDITKLPFKNETVDCILNLAVLEHVPSPEKVTEEMNRILKKDGLICCYLPFIVGYHASPFDFSRLTEEGVKHLFRNFEILELKVGGGPTSGLLWIFQEWLALFLSFGSKKLHMIVYMLLMVITSPLKLFDLILIHHPLAKNIASGFIIIARKKS